MFIFKLVKLRGFKQVALPQGIAQFVFARDYNVFKDILNIM